MSIMVSIICNTYNQESYIKQAIESLINQKTDFEYEIIIHDDASTDSTTNIVKEYASRYPDLIIPIIETENQYSKEVDILLDIELPIVNGKYFALCEGDDYWIDSLKLQKQVDYMEQHPNCTLCIHKAIKVSKEGRNIGTYGEFSGSGIIPIETVIKFGGAFCATNSILAPTRLLKSVPKYLINYSIDYFWQIYLAGEGYTYCFMDKMSAYRVNSNGSWTQRTRNDIDFCLKHFKHMCDNLKLYDMETEFKYHELIQDMYLNYLYKYYVAKGEFQELKKEPLKTYVKKLTLKEKIKLYLKHYFPNIFETISKMRQNIFE